MSILYFNGLTLVCVLGIIWGIKLMNSPETAKQGNLLGAISLMGTILLTLYKYQIMDQALLWLGMIIGGVIGSFIAIRITMVKMPQMIALLNGLGGGASALVAIMILLANDDSITIFSRGSAIFALIVGGFTFSGSMVAALKLDQKISQLPVRIKGHSLIMGFFLISVTIVYFLIMTPHINVSFYSTLTLTLAMSILALSLGVLFTVRVGGADMPITISLFNSLSGVAGAIAGFAIYDPLLIAVGGIVGASGLILTQVMCKGMNRNLLFILGGNTTLYSSKDTEVAVTTEEIKNKLEDKLEEEQKEDIKIRKILEEASNIVIVPGYGMALAQAQFQVKSLYDYLTDKGKEVRFAIHPVAGRMPGHMNVLLAEVDIPCDKLYELQDINAEFEKVDLAIVIGANDVINPAANTAKDTPIFGMPILEVQYAKNIIICNWDTNPGYSGVPNTLYQNEKVILRLGDAKETVLSIEAALASEKAKEVLVESSVNSFEKDSTRKIIEEASKIVIVPGYGMALAQAQYQVKMLYDSLIDKGKDIRFAIHPVAGRMPGHMNVLLAEVDIPYDELYELEDINDDFKNVDLVIVVGANDVINPAANIAKDTPIYGMPILEVEHAKKIIICNWDTNPGYSGVANTLYQMDKVILKLGDAKETLADLI